MGLRPAAAHGVVFFPMLHQSPQMEKTELPNARRNPESIFLQPDFSDKKCAIREVAPKIAETDINGSEMFIEEQAKRRYDKMGNGVDAFFTPKRYPKQKLRSERQGEI